MRLIPILLMIASYAGAQVKNPPRGWELLFNNKDLTGWEAHGEGQWKVLSDGTLAGQRVWERKALAPGRFESVKDYQQWSDVQAWLYTKKDYADFELHVEFWTKAAGNSGIALRDTTRGKHALQIPVDFTKTPSKVAYEVQINNRYPDPNTTGSIYRLSNAPKEPMKEDDWNAMDIEAVGNRIRVKLNGVEVSNVECPPDRPKSGGIGLQLHDQFSVILFRNIWIRVR